MPYISVRYESQKLVDIGDVFVVTQPDGTQLVYLVSIASDGKYFLVSLRTGMILRTFNPETPVEDMIEFLSSFLQGEVIYVPNKFACIVVEFDSPVAIVKERKVDEASITS